MPAATALTENAPPALVSSPACIAVRHTSDCSGANTFGDAQPVTLLKAYMMRSSQSAQRTENQHDACDSGNQNKIGPRKQGALRKSMLFKT